MPYKDVTYDKGFTERFYYNETSDEEALRMNRVKSFPSANHRSEVKRSSIWQDKVIEPDTDG